MTTFSKGVAVRAGQVSLAYVGREEGLPATPQRRAFSARGGFLFKAQTLVASAWLTPTLSAGTSVTFYDDGDDRTGAGVARGAGQVGEC